MIYFNTIYKSTFEKRQKPKFHIITTKKIKSYTQKNFISKKFLSLKFLSMMDSFVMRFVCICFNATFDNCVIVYQSCSCFAVTCLSKTIFPVNRLHADTAPVLYATQTGTAPLCSKKMEHNDIGINFSKCEQHEKK